MAAPVEILSRLLWIRDTAALPDAALADQLGMGVKDLNALVQAHPERFPEILVFHLRAEERQKIPGAPVLAFTEAGAALLAGLVPGRDAALLALLPAFAEARQVLTAQAELAARTGLLEQKMEVVLKALQGEEDGTASPERPIGFVQEGLPKGLKARQKTAKPKSIVIPLGCASPFADPPKTAQANWMQIQGPITLLILDGFGDGPRNAYDATFVAAMPRFNALRKTYAATQLLTGGEAVGLPEGQFGNSEVGHMNLGAGRVVWQELTRIDAAIRRGTFRENGPIGALMADLKASGKRLHLLGLVSDGGVHSHQNHLVALAQWAQAEGLPTTIHAITDGRDTAQKSADGFLQWLTFQLRDCPLVGIGSVCGRYTAMDRDKRWERTEQAWKLYVDGEAAHRAPDTLAAIAAAYGRGETDEFIAPTQLDAFHPMADGDGVLFFNFRADRARQMCHALVHPAFSGFKPKHRPKVSLLTFTAYDAELDPYVSVAYPPQSLDHILGELISAEGWKQFRTAETEKYAHVTYFFNGGREVPFEGEERRLVPSPKVATYDLQPEMSLADVSQGLEAAIRSGQYRLLVSNLANPDMVGHTGDLAAAIRACEAVDAAIGRIADATLAAGGALFITADHGNCECMRDEAGNPHTAHTLNPVPAVLVAKGFEGVQLRSGGALADVAPTLLNLFGLPQPASMDGKSLL